MVVQAQDLKTEVLVAPATVTLATNSSTYGYLDTLGWDYATILAIGSKEATTSASFKVCKLTEGTNSTAATAIVAFTGGTATSASVGFVIPVYKGTAEGTVVRMNIDLHKRERYIRIHLAPGTASNVAAIALLSRGAVMPGTDAGSVTKDVIG